MTRHLPSPELLRKLLVYVPHSGELFWRARTPDMFDKASQNAEHICKAWNARHAGKPAFNFKNKTGHFAGRWKNTTLLKHRVAFAIFYGVWPSGHIDHINGNPGDNRIENLRDVPVGENAKNAKRRKDNKSGFSGVTLITKTGKFRSRIGHNGQYIHLGTFESFQVAKQAVLDARKKLGYHENHDRHGVVWSEPHPDQR